MVTKYNIDDTVYIKGTVSMIKIDKVHYDGDAVYDVKVKDSPGNAITMIMREKDIIAGGTSTSIPVDIGTLKNLRNALNRVNATSSDGHAIICECRAILKDLIDKYEMKEDK